MIEFKIGYEVILIDDYRIEYRVISIYVSIFEGLTMIKIEPINQEHLKSIMVYPSYIRFSSIQLRDNRLKELGI